MVWQSPPVPGSSRGTESETVSLGLVTLPLAQPDFKSFCFVTETHGISDSGPEFVDGHNLNVPNNLLARFRPCDWPKPPWSMLIRRVENRGSGFETRSGVWYSGGALMGGAINTLVNFGVFAEKKSDG